MELLLQRIRSWMFDAALAAWTAMFLPVVVVLLACGRPRRLVRAASRFWATGVLKALRWTVGVTHVEHGRENLPAQPCLIVANHQSAWETIAFLILVPDVAIIAKKELLRVPVMGWFLRNSPMILVDRTAGAGSIRQMLTEARNALASGRHVLIFPEGTRQSPTTPVEFKRGVELLYSQLGVPVLPVALDSGLFWGKESRSKRPGAITLSYLAPIEPGLSTREFVRRAQVAVQNALSARQNVAAAAADLFSVPAAPERI